MDGSDDRMGQALRQHFAVLADLLLTDKVDVQQLLHAVKLGFVASARHSHGLNDKPASVRRIAELTGMSTKEVKELLDEANMLVWSDHIAAPDDLPRLIASSLTALVSTIRDNWKDRHSEGFMQRVGQATKIDSSKIPGLRKKARDLARRYMQDFDDLLVSCATDDSTKMMSPECDELARLGLGTYYFEIRKNQ